MQDAVIVSAVRTAVGKAPAGTLRATRPDEMAAVVMRDALARFSASIMMNISIRLWFVGGHVDWTR